MSSPATIIIENFPIHNFEAKSRLNKDLHALYMKSGGFSPQGCIKREICVFKKADAHYKNVHWSLLVALIHFKTKIMTENICGDPPASS